MHTENIDSAQPALSVQGVTKRYPSGFTLDGVTFDLPMGYIMGLIGPNGAGKSTLIKLMLNMIRRDSGSITLLGLDAVSGEEAIKNQLGVVFDVSYLLESWTVNKAERAVAPLYDQWDSARFDDYLRRFGLLRSKRIRELSRGMQMKLMLAIALSHHARLLILDEPTSGLDVLMRDELMDILREFIADGEHSVLFSTHITKDLERAADLITYINRGRLFFTGPKDDFEDAFRIVKGGPDDLDESLSSSALGLRRYPTGFDALVRTAQLEQTGSRLASERGRYLVERASIDDIIVLTNSPVSGEQHPASTSWERADNGPTAESADEGGRS